MSGKSGLAFSTGDPQVSTAEALPTMANVEAARALTSLVTVVQLRAESLWSTTILRPLMPPVEFTYAAQASIPYAAPGTDRGWDRKGRPSRRW